MKLKYNKDLQKRSLYLLRLLYFPYYFNENLKRQHIATFFGDVATPKTVQFDIEQQSCNVDHNCSVVHVGWWLLSHPYVYADNYSGTEKKNIPLETDGAAVTRNVFSFIDNKTIQYNYDHRR